MVLIFAAPWDLLAAGVAAELTRRHRDHLVLDAAWATESALVWTPSPFAGYFEHRGRRLDLANVTGVFARHDSFGADPVEGLSGDEVYVRAERASALLALLDAMPCPVVNRPPATPHARATLLGGAAARRAGMRTAPLLFTSERTAALSACAPAGVEGGVVVGRPSGAWDDRHAGDATGAAVDALLPHGAVLIRARGGGEQFRVFVAGRRVIGYRVPSSSMDGARLVPHRVPDPVRASVRTLADELGVELMCATLTEHGGEPWVLDVDVAPAMPVECPDVASEVAAGVADVVTGSARP